MRNRDSRHVHAVWRWAAVVTLLPVVLVAVATQAVADAGGQAMTSSFGVAGPVGIVAVLAGFGGLVAGLLRRRRTEVARSEAPTAVIEKIVDPVRPESAA